MFQYLGTLIAMVFFHEFGHLLYFKLILNKKPGLIFKKPCTIQVGQPKDYVFLTKKQRLHIYLWGIIIGFIPLFIVPLSFGSILALITVYLVLCHQDIQNSYKCVRDIVWG